jgi:hypothetical protein
MKNNFLKFQRKFMYQLNSWNLSKSIKWYLREKFIDIENGKDYRDPALSCGHLPLGQINLLSCFGTKDYQTIWDILSSHSDIFRIEVDGVSNTFDYCWTDSTYKQMQIDIMRPGYDFSSRR